MIKHYCLFFVYDKWNKAFNPIEGLNLIEFTFTPLYVAQGDLGERNRIDITLEVLNTPKTKWIFEQLKEAFFSRVKIEFKIFYKGEDKFKLQQAEVIEILGPQCDDKNQERNIVVLRGIYVPGGLTEGRWLHEKTIKVKMKKDYFDTGRVDIAKGQIVDVLAREWESKTEICSVEYPKTNTIKGSEYEGHTFILSRAVYKKDLEVVPDGGL
jgi:hypothetical protein